MRVFSFTLLVIFFIGCRSGISLDSPILAKKTDWTQFGGAKERTNRVDDEIEPPLELLWTASASGELGSGSPITADDFALIPSIAGGVDIRSIQTGEGQGYVNVRGIIKGAPVFLDSLLFVPLSLQLSPTLNCINMRTGKTIWKAKAGAIETSLLAADQFVISAAVTGEVKCYNTLDSIAIWSLTLPKALQAAPSCGDSTVFIGCNNGDVYALNLRDGTQRWRLSTGAAVTASGPVGKKQIFITNRAGDIICADILDGKEIWRRNVSAPIYGAPALDEEILFVPVSDGALLAISTKNGEIIWEQNFDSVVNTSPIVSKKYVFAASLDKSIRALEKMTGKEVWIYRTDSSIKTSPIIANGVLIVCERNGKVLAFGRRASR